MANGDHKFAQMNNAPITEIEEDAFGIEKYVKSVARFLEKADAPITICLQGVSGSGRTSFMRLLEKELCLKKDEDNESNTKVEYSSIWIDLSEGVVSQSGVDAQQEMVRSFLVQLGRSFNEFDKRLNKRKVKRGAKKAVMTVSGVVTTIFGVGADSDAVGDAWDSILSKARDSFQDVREDVEAIIKEHTKNEGLEGYIVFIDGLDRIDAADAVRALQVMSTNLNIVNCKFVVAADFEMLKSGIERTSGKYECIGRDRAVEFFDRVFQATFSIPVSKYSIIEPVVNGLKSIDFFEDESCYEKYKDELDLIFSEITLKNPRSIKAYLNQTQIVIDFLEGVEGSDDPEFRMLALCVIGLKRRYYGIYKKLTRGFEEIENIDEILKNKEDYADCFAFAEKLKGYYWLCVNKNLPVEEIFSVLYLSGRDLDNEAIQFYDGHAYDASSQTQHSQGLELIDKVDFSNVANMLDVGCGNGTTTLEAWEKNRSMEVDAYDLSPDQIEVAKDNLAGKLNSFENEGFDVSEFGEVKFKVGGFSDVQEKCKFDLVFSNSALHWSKQPEQDYKRLFDSLKPGGRLAVHQGGKDTYRGLHDAAWQAIAKCGFTDRYREFEFPAYYPSSVEFEGLLKRVGFENVRIEEIETQGKEYEHLPKNFGIASLIYYQLPKMSDEDFNKIVEEYNNIVASGDVDLYTHRLYAFAEKPNC